MAHFGRGTRTEASRGRRLWFEYLEHRDLLAVMRLVNWNTLNGPNNPAGDANFQTVFDGIANETLAGNTKRIDILALQETDPPGTGNESIVRIESIFDALYPMSDYASAVSSVDGGGDSTGFVYDTSTVSLLDFTEVLPMSLTHHVLRGKFRPAATLGESDFYVYSVHLKSGDTGSDVAIRGTEASLLRADADALGEGAHVLFVGDFNMQSSSEAAYGNFVAAGAGQVQDVVPESTGNWNDNPAFKGLHTQDPRTTMDDRFDLQLASGEFFDSVGVEYVANSFRVFGNDGSHTLDQPITTGSGASAAVLTALVNASDHLPVVADYEVLVSTPGVRTTETGGGTKVVEGGLFDTYSVVLDTVPLANVTVTVTPNSQVDLGNGAGVARVLTFTPGDALTPQTIVVNAANDLVGEGNHTGLITHASSSADAAYNGLSIDSVSVMIVDNDAPTIVINEIDSDTVGTDMLEFVELYDGGVGNVSLAGLSIVFFNGNGDISYAAFDLTGFSTDANGFFVLGNASVPNVDMVFADNTLQNGQDAVALYAALASAFPNGTSVTTTNLLDAVVYGTNDPDDAELQVMLEAGQLQLNENSGGNGTGHSLSRVPDAGDPRKTETYVARTPTPGALNQTQAPGVLIIQSGTRVDVEEGGFTDSYQLALQTIPTSSVVITIDPDAQSDLGEGAGVQIVLTFTPENALIPQTVTVTAVDDAAVEGVHTSVITHTAFSLDSGYDGLAIGNVVANIVDNDEPAATSIVISEIMYNPASDENSPGVGEWIEIINTGTTAVDLSGWLFDDEDGSNWGAISAGTILNPNQAAVFFDTAFTTAAAFRAEWAVPAGALVVGVSWGALANTPGVADEILTLLNDVGAPMDQADYDDAAPWPTGVNGPSIYLKGLSLDNNDGLSWGRSTAGAGGTVSPSGPTFDVADVGSPGRFFLPGDYNASGVVDAADYVVWRKTNGSVSDLRADGSGATFGVPDGVVDQLDYDFWRANFGLVGIPGGGSGAETVGMAAIAAASGQSVQNSPGASLVSLPAATEEVLGDVLAVDAAVTEFGSLPPLSKSTVPTKPTLRFAPSQQVAASLDLLLAVDRASSTKWRADGSLDTLAASADIGRYEADAFFASLDELSLAAVGERF